MGILSGLGKKKIIEPVILSVEILILEILKKSFKSQTDSSLIPEIEILKYKNFINNFLNVKGGFVLKFYTNSVKTPLFVFVPDNFISKYVSIKNIKDPESELLNIFGHIPEYLLMEIDREDNFVTDSKVKPVSLSLIGSSLISKDEFLWNTSGSIIIQINYHQSRKHIDLTMHRKKRMILYLCLNL